MKRIQLLLLTFIFTFTASVAPSIQVFAFDASFYGANDILYYDPEARDTCANDSAALSGNNNLEKVYNFMLGKGLSDFQAAGVVGNVARESGGYPNQLQGSPPGVGPNDPSGVTSGWGLIQWTPGKKVIGIATDAKETGKISELATQLNIVWWHMNDTTPTGVKNFITEYKNTTTVEQATTLYEKKMEAAGVPALPDRIAAAKIALKYTQSPSSNTGCGAGAVAGSAIQTAINYAWPKYHPADYTVMKPSYADAIKKAQANKEYVGGGQYPGIDCGGFVTRVVRDSGLDSEYNKGNGPVNTQLQYVTSSVKWTEIHPKSASDLDAAGGFAVAIKAGQHTYMYVGKNDGFETTIASASYGSWRTPMAGHEMPADPNYRWFIPQLDTTPKASLSNI